jgi:Ca2+-binding RTX toxin-like protein
MITAKAFRPTSERSQPTREDYVESERDNRRFVPVAFLLFLTGCAAYLKSFLPVKTEAHEVQTASRYDDGEGDAGRADEIVAVTEEDVAGDTASRAARSSDNVIPIRIFQESGDLSAGGSPPIEPARPGLVRVGSGPIGETIRPGNDSRMPTPSNSEGGGGGGGGGGGSGGRNGGGGGVDPQPKPRSPDPPSGPTPDPVHNRTPRTSGPVHLQDVVGCQVMMISMLALLAGATDPDGDRLIITGLSSSSGTLTPTEEGGWMFVRNEGMLGDVILTYRISDGSASVLQTAYFSVIEPPPIIGTDSDDNLLGTRCADAIDGRAGDDNIDAREGNDTIIGGAGNDNIVAGAGNDVVYAGAGHDVVFAGAGNDIVFGGSGNDRLFGEEGNDTLMGDDGDDFLSGGGGSDILIAGTGNDTVQGDAGSDTLDGGDGDDNLTGGEGNDVIMAAGGSDCLLGNDGSDILFDGTGNDAVHGGSGSDYVVAAADAANDVYDGGEGRDTLDYSAAAESLTIDLGNAIANGGDTGHDQIANFEDVVGGSGPDHIIAGSTSLSMSGRAGNDCLEGGAGNDAISDGTGCDTVRAGGGDDRVLAAADEANDSYSGGAGQDQLDYSTATVSITIDLGEGTADGLDIGHDLIASFEEIIAGAGDDRIVAGSSSVSMAGGDGDDTFEFQRQEEDQQAIVVRKITDFTVGDRIIAATYQIGYLQDGGGAADQLCDMFNDVYLSGNTDNLPVRFRFEQVDSNDVTFVDVHDRPETGEFFTIEVVGHHQLQFTVAVA